MLSFGVALLVAIDVIILAVYTIVEYLHGDLRAIRVVNRENPEDLIGVSYYASYMFVSYALCSFNGEESLNVVNVVYRNLISM